MCVHVYKLKSSIRRCYSVCTIDIDITIYVSMVCTGGWINYMSIMCDRINEDDCFVFFELMLIFLKFYVNKLMTANRMFILCVDFASLTCVRLLFMSSCRKLKSLV